MKFFVVKGPSLWGDYGRLLASGIVQSGASEDAPVLLFRTGPFIPPISLPRRHVVVTDAFRAEIESSELFTFEYREVVKQHIAKLHWENWDRRSEDPQKYPRGDEPEGYILKRWHSRRAAKEMGLIWELILPRAAETASVTGPAVAGRLVMVNEESWLGDHFFHSSTQGWAIASELGRDWLKLHAGEWLSFQKCIDWDPRALDSKSSR